MKIIEYSDHNVLRGAKVDHTQDNMVQFITYSIFGSIFLALMSQISIPLPFTPVPLTMQTLALLLLVVAQGKNKAVTSVIFYLAQATIGLPVLAGGLANPLWLMMPTSGYLVGFIGCVWVAGYLLERKNEAGFFWTFFSLASGLSIVFLLGTFYLSLYIGWKNAFHLGVLPFLSIDLIKLIAASFSNRLIRRVVSIF